MNTLLTKGDHPFCHTHTHNCFTALWILSGTTQVSRYQKKHSPTDSCHGHQSSLICFIHLIRSMASSLFNQRTWPSFSTISIQVFFGLPLGLAPSTSYSIISSPNHCLFLQHMPIPSQPVLQPSLSTLYLLHHSHLCPLNATSFFFLTGQVSLPCNFLLCTQPLYNLPLTFPTNHNLGFIHIYSHTSILHKILSLINPFNYKVVQ